MSGWRMSPRPNACGRSSARFLENPADPRYLAASWQSGHTDSGLHYRRYPFFAALRERAGPVTWVMMIACVVVFIAMQILGDQEVMLWLAWYYSIRR